MHPACLPEPLNQSFLPVYLAGAWSCSGTRIVSIPLVCLNPKPKFCFLPVYLAGAWSCLKTLGTTKALHSPLLNVIGLGCEVSLLQMLQGLPGAAYCKAYGTENNTACYQLGLQDR